MIKGWNIGRLQRYGIISLGVKNPDGSPKAVDYFVVPPEVAKVYGEKPRELDVMFPSDDIDTIMSWYLRRYGKQTGLICKGDNEWAFLKYSYALGPGKKEYGLVVENGKVISEKTGEQLDVFLVNTKKWIRIPCSAAECKFYQHGICKQTAYLNVLLPKVPGALGVYTIQTASWNSCANLLGAFDMLEKGSGRIRFVPVKLQVKIQEVHPELSDGRSVKNVVPVLMIAGEWTLEELIMARLKGDERILPPNPPSYTIADDDFEEKTPELLFPDSNKRLPPAVEASDVGETETEIDSAGNPDISVSADSFNPDILDVEDTLPLDNEETSSEAFSGSELQLTKGNIITPETNTVKADAINKEPISTPETKPEVQGAESQTTTKVAGAVSNNARAAEEHPKPETTAQHPQVSGSRSSTRKHVNPAPNQMEFTAARPGEKMKMRNGAGETAWVRAQCTFGRLKGRVVDVWAEPNSQAVEKIGGMAPGTVFAALSKRERGNNQVLVDDIQIVAGPVAETAVS